MMNESGLIGRMRNSVALKLIVVGILVLLLSIPTVMVQSLITEREQRKYDVVMDISSRWGAAQWITGPIITIPYRYYSHTNNKGVAVYQTGYAHFLPKALEISGQLRPEIRYRGIYQVVLYNGQLQLRGHFESFDFARLNIPEQDVFWDRAFFSLGISDMKGIKEKIVLMINSASFSLDPGIETQEVLTSGLSTRLPIKNLQQRQIPFELLLDLNGSDRIQFVPVGEVSEVKLTSSWKSPSFEGAFLPVDRQVNETGFQARWKVLHLNRNFPQAWSGGKIKMNDAAFGVRFFVAANIYQQSTRNAKYALLFIVLTFTLFFFSEILNQKPVHFIQYLFIGFALVIFYSLLIALSEQIGFGKAYLISSIAVTSLITLYSKWILNSRKIMAVIGSLMALLYGYLYMLLQMEDYALLMGSIGLFVALASVMVVTRKMDWFGGNNR